jgi:hypothetical protein
MRKHLALFVILLTVLCLPAHAAQRDVSGNYEASVMGSVIKARIEQAGADIRGVAYVYSGGKKNTYHFIGTVNGNRIQANHSDGHAFNGNVTPEGNLIGVLRTRGGHNLSVNAARR